MSKSVIRLSTVIFKNIFKVNDNSKSTKSLDEVPLKSSSENISYLLPELPYKFDLNLAFVEIW